MPPTIAVVDLLEAAGFRVEQRLELSIWSIPVAVVVAREPGLWKQGENA